jgi:ATP-dependent Clp protease protease subunit
MSNGAVAEQPLPPIEVYGIFAGDIYQMAVGRLASAAAIASSNNVTHIHLAFQTRGGTVPDGVAIYNLFRAIPTPLTLYNIGSISSAGVLAYLGAPNRASSEHATFMIHRTTSPTLGVTSERLHAIAKAVVLDDARTEAIYALSKLDISAEQWAVHKVADLWLSAEEAKAAKLVTEIKEFAPPKGIQMFYVNST